MVKIKPITTYTAWLHKCAFPNNKNAVTNVLDQTSSNVKRNMGFIVKYADKQLRSRLKSNHSLNNTDRNRLLNDIVGSFATDTTIVDEQESYQYIDTMIDNMVPLIPPTLH